MQVLETVSATAWEEAEKKWIRQFRSAGVDLVNMTEGGGSHAGHASAEETKKKISDAAIRQFSSEEARKAAAEYGRRAWQDPAVAARLLKARRAKSEDPEYIRKQSEAKKKLYSDPEYKERLREAHIGCHSAGAKRMWDRPEYRAAQAAARARRYGAKAHG